MLMLPLLFPCLFLEDTAKCSESFLEVCVKLAASPLMLQFLPASGGDWLVPPPLQEERAYIKDLRDTLAPKGGIDYCLNNL
jgi:hypothetical protein